MPTHTPSPPHTEVNIKGWNSFMTRTQSEIQALSYKRLAKALQEIKF